MVLFGEGLGHALKDALGVLPMVVEVDATSVLVDLASIENSFDSISTNRCSTNYLYRIL